MAGGGHALSVAAPAGKALQLALIALVEVLAMGLWFSASAVVPQLAAEWQLTPAEQAWMTMSVQLGFVVGALASALSNLADRVPTRWLVAAAAAAGALFNAAIPALAEGPGSALVLRFCTGVALAGVYPPGMKLVVSWCREDRGLGIGLLVGALTVGSAVPHLLNAFPLFGSAGLPPWPAVLYVASALAGVAALVAALCAREGPWATRASQFHWRHATAVFSYRPTRLANFGYLGHMWELYAMWAWVPLFLLASYREAGYPESAGRVAGFAAIAIGGVGCVVAGQLADRLGRTRVAIWSLAVSGSCCVVAGALEAFPVLLTAVCLVWGFAVVADSAQFSAALSELSDPRYTGTALTMQVCLGFLLTLFTIWLVPELVSRLGWAKSFPVLAIGPAFGIWSMARLRTLPEARKMASGNR